MAVLLALRHSEGKAALLVGRDVTHLLRAGGVCVVAAKGSARESRGGEPTRQGLGGTLL